MAVHCGKVFSRAIAVAAVLVLAAGLVVAPPLGASAAGRGEAAKAKKDAGGSIYLFLGLANVFSTGLDDLGGQLRARGVRNTVLNYGNWPGVAGEIEARYRTGRGALPVVIIGHSFGADAAVATSAELGRKGIPVALVVTFDATYAAPVPPNVRHLINYYSATDGIGKRLPAARGFHGRLENINVDALRRGIGHFDIEKYGAFHSRVIGEVLGVMRASPSRAAGVR